MGEALEKVSINGTRGSYEKCKGAWGAPIMGANFWSSPLPVGNVKTTVAFPSACHFHYHTFWHVGMNDSLNLEPPRETCFFVYYSV